MNLTVESGSVKEFELGGTCQCNGSPFSVGSCTVFSIVSIQCSASLFRVSVSRKKWLCIGCIQTGFKPWL